MALPAHRIHSREYNAVYFHLPASARRQIIGQIREFGERLADYPHERFQGLRGFRLRAGDYRIIYDFDIAKNTLLLGSLGHGSKIYKGL